MAIGEKLEYLNDTKTAIKGALRNRGVTVSDADTFRSYADKVGQIGETVEKIKLGASVDTWIGNVRESDGSLQKTTWKGALNFAGVKSIGSAALNYRFYHLDTITSVDLSSVTYVWISGLFGAFEGCTEIKSADLSSLKEVDLSGMKYAFRGCSKIESVNMKSLQTVQKAGLEAAFENCSVLTSVDLSSLKTLSESAFSYGCYGTRSLTSINLDSLQTIGSNAFSSAFTASALKTISFPSLTSVQSSSFGSASYNYAFSGTLTEIHFRADMQATIEAMTGYSSKWGATNATVYFDL